MTVMSVETSSVRVEATQGPTLAGRACPASRGVSESWGSDLSQSPNPRRASQARLALAGEEVVHRASRGHVTRLEAQEKGLPAGRHVPTDPSPLLRISLLGSPAVRVK